MGRYLVSQIEGTYPQWSSGSNALHFASRNAVYSVTFTAAAGAAPVIGAPTLLYRRDPWGSVGIAPDGKTVAFVDRVREGEPKALVVRLNAVSAQKH